MNKWKIAFWVCFTTLILVLALGLYSILDQGVSRTYMKEGYMHTEDDLVVLTEIIKDTHLTKGQIRKSVSKQEHFKNIDFNSDTISLDRMTFIFKGNRLDMITKQW